MGGLLGQATCGVKGRPTLDARRCKAGMGGERASHDEGG
jgi:hypothetical protein